MMSEEMKETAATLADISNPREVMAMIALVVVVGYLLLVAGVIAFHLVPDPTNLLSGVGALAAGVVYFYFGKKAAE